ncbi:MAG: 5-methyltetrahydropteroyltriglutamate--homocysteine S-methyltransferase [Patescibacteria group bacterium]
MRTTNLGFPNVYQSLIKVTVEKFWRGEAIEEDVRKAYAEVQKYNRAAQDDLDLIPVGEIDLYDRLLATAVRFGIVPSRFGRPEDALRSLSVYLSIPRGAGDKPASPMVKWFNTNYHVVQPEIEKDPSWQKEAPLPDLSDPRHILALIGPWTLLSYSINSTSRSIPELFAILASEYQAFINSLPAHTKIQLEEPSFLTHGIPEGYEDFLAGVKREAHLHVYFGAVNDFADRLFSMLVAGIGLDFIDGPENLSLLSSFPRDKILIAGVINGRNVWPVSTRTEKILGKIRETISDDRLYISPSCSLLHAPLSAKGEKMPFSFAEEKIAELKAVKAGNAAYAPFTPQNTALPEERFERRRKTYWVSDIAYPTTTIGSFPQTADVRKARSDWRAGKITDADYERYMHGLTKECVEKQEKLGLDLLVHGEFERNDMVQYFAENFSGFTVIKGPVQSYGTRHVRPPVITGPVSRPRPFTVPWSTYAQSCASSGGGSASGGKKPVKGMLTGPVTIVKWSYPREDMEPEAHYYEVARALAEEVRDLAEAGITHIQIDEPALREALPLNRKLHARYLHHAVNSFRLVYASVPDEVVIHTHMCFSEFNDILNAIKDMGADVLLIEDSKSKGKVAASIRDSGFPASIGLGVYDVHSPRLPTVEEMLVIPESLDMDPRRIWINPDCGLKTRGEEAFAQLERMMEAVRILRKGVADKK